MSLVEGESLSREAERAAPLLVVHARDDVQESCTRIARYLVGRLGLKEAQALLRATMSVEALQRTGGSRRAAAKLLGVTRRYVQLLVEEHASGERVSSVE